MQIAVVEENVLGAGHVAFTAMRRNPVSCGARVQANALHGVGLYTVLCMITIVVNGKALDWL